MFVSNVIPAFPSGTSWGSTNEKFVSSVPFGEIIGKSFNVIDESSITPLVGMCEPASINVCRTRKVFISLRRRSYPIGTLRTLGGTKCNDPPISSAGEEFSRDVSDNPSF